MKNVENTLINMPRIIYICSFLSIIITGNIEFSYFFIFTLLFSTGLNKLIKNLFKITQILPKKIGDRPSGCGGPKIKGLCRGCSIDPAYKNKIGSTTYGFPSGHSHISALAASFWTLYIINKNQKLLPGHYISIILLWIITIAVLKQRLDCKCHNIYQVMTGLIVGGLLGILGYHICHKLAPNTYPLNKFKDILINN